MRIRSARRRRGAILLLFGFSTIFLFGGCENFRNLFGDKNATADVKQAIEFVTVDQGYYSGNNTAGGYVVTDNLLWQNLWQIHTANLLPPPTAPAIDFARDMVIGVFMGQKPTGGYTAAIARVYLADTDDIVVNYRESYPLPGMAVTQALTAPYHIIKFKLYPHKGIVFKNIN